MAVLLLPSEKNEYFNMSKKEKSKASVMEDEDINGNATSEDNVKEEQIDPVTELQEQYENEKDRYLRLFAEFENYKKRTGRERIDLFKTAGQDVIVSLLPVMDDFDRALKEIEKSDDDSLYKGVELISNKLRETLRAKGLEVIETKPGDAFNADHHEAVTQIPAPTPDLRGKIIDVLEMGYTLGEKIIRYPKVVIGQ